MTDSYHFTNLVFEGGGVKGIAYAGAMQALEKQSVLPNIKRVGGTSAGAINAVLLATGYTPEETRDVLAAMNFKNFMDDSWGVIRDAKRLIKKYGWYKGDYFRTWIAKIIDDKINQSEATFSDFKKLGLLDLYLVGTNISTGFSEVFSAEHTPDMCVADAARISMSLPLFFTAIRNSKDEIYVDGGVLRNYPIKLFDRSKYIERGKKRKHANTAPYYRDANQAKPVGSTRHIYNKQTLGFKLDTKEEIAMFLDGAKPPVAKIDDFFDYGVELVRTIMNSQQNTHLHSDDWQRTIYLDSLNIGTTDFGLNDEKRNALMKSGVDGVNAYFKWYDSRTTDDLPSNHPEYA